MQKTSRLSLSAWDVSHRPLPRKSRSTIGPTLSWLMEMWRTMCSTVLSWCKTGVHLLVLQTSTKTIEQLSSPNKDPRKTQPSKDLTAFTLERALHWVSQTLSRSTRGDVKLAVESDYIVPSGGKDSLPSASEGPRTLGCFLKCSFWSKQWNFLGDWISFIFTFGSLSVWRDTTRVTPRASVIMSLCVFPLNLLWSKSGVSTEVTQWGPGVSPAVGWPHATNCCAGAFVDERWEFWEPDWGCELYSLWCAPRASMPSLEDHPRPCCSRYSNLLHRVKQWCSSIFWTCSWTWVVAGLV